MWVCVDLANIEHDCSGWAVEERARMCSTKPQQTVNITEGGNGISQERLTVGDVNSCFNLSHSTVRCSSVIIRDKRMTINTSTPQKDKISEMCQLIEAFWLWFHKVKHEAAGFGAIILTEWTDKKHYTYRDSALSLSPRSGALWPSSWTVASCHRSHLSCLSSLWRKEQKKKSALTPNVPNINVL